MPRGRSSIAPVYLRWAGIAAALLAAVAAGFVLLGGRQFVLWYAPAINAMALGFYAYDKAAAGRGRERIPEVILHLLALAGASPAALVGQRLFRHKTRKTSFQAVFWLIVGVQLAGAVWAAHAWFGARGWNAAALTAAAAGWAALVNVAAAALYPRLRGRGTGARHAAARVALVVLGGAWGAALRDRLGAGEAWLPYLVGAAYLGGALAVAFCGVQATA